MPIGFRKSYFMDALASSGAVFELKAVDAIHPRHRSQLLNYLLLTELQHGKLVNVRTEKVEHEFVNATQTRADRIRYEIHDTEWQPSKGFGSSEKMLIQELLQDWGTGLERSLYEEASIYFLGGKDIVVSDIDVILDGKALTSQSAFLSGPHSDFNITTFDNCTNNYRNDLCQFLAKTSLQAIQWINITRNHVTFETIT